MNDFLKRLTSMGFNPDGSENLKLELKNSCNIADMIKGEWLNEQERAVYISESVLPYPICHGNLIIKNNPDFQFFSILLDDPAFNSFLSDQFLFLDIETTNISMGVGTFIFMVGLCWFTDQGINIRQIFLEDLSKEPVLLSYTQDLIKKFSTLVTFNGKTFDIPLLRSRLYFYHIPENIRSMWQIDLLYLSRKIFKRIPGSKKLIDIENEILNFRRTSADIPGWLIPQVYFDYLELGESELIRNIFYHNQMDIISLAVLTQYFAWLFNEKKSKDIVDRGEQFSIAELLLKNQSFSLSKDFFEKAIIGNNDLAFDVGAMRNFGYVLKKSGDWSRALEIWQISAEEGDVDAHIELAKFYEHRKKEYQVALEWTEKAIKILKNQRESSSAMMINLNHRKHRLLQKSNNNG